MRPDRRRAKLVHFLRSGTPKQLQILEVSFTVSYARVMPNRKTAGRNILRMQYAVTSVTRNYTSWLARTATTDSAALAYAPTITVHQTQ